MANDADAVVHLYALQFLTTLTIVIGHVVNTRRNVDALQVVAVLEDGPANLGDGVGQGYRFQSRTIESIVVERGQRCLLCQIDISKFATGVECTLADTRGTISQGDLGQCFTTLKYPAWHFLDILREGKRAQRVAVQECPVTQRRDGLG